MQEKAEKDYTIEVPTSICINCEFYVTASRVKEFKCESRHVLCLMCYQGYVSFCQKRGETTDDECPRCEGKAIDLREHIKAEKC